MKVTGAMAGWGLAGIALSAIALASACKDSELGACDPEAAEQLVYGRGGLIATKGQALVHDSCGNAAFCHSAGATGHARFGAPAGMDFDMLPAPKGWISLSDHRDE